MKETIKKINSDIIFLIAIALLPFENFFFAPSGGWATITPVIFVIYLLCNFKLLIKEFVKFKKFVIFFIIAMTLSCINYVFVGFEIINIVNSLISLGLGFVSLFSFDIYYNKTKNLEKVVKILMISYIISMLIGIVQYIAIKFDVKFLYTFFDFIFKRNYLKYDRVQYFFTEPSFIGMHLFGILLPLYFISRNKKLVYIIVAFCASACIFSSGVRILLDICIVTVVLLFEYLIKNKKYKYIFIIPVVAIVSLMIAYNTNVRVKGIFDRGIYADGSLASRYFRIQASVYGYTKNPTHLLLGYGLGNSLIPLQDGYDDARITYKSSYLDEVLKLSNPNLKEDCVSYCLYIRFTSEFGVILAVIAIAYILKITKNSNFYYKYSYLLITLYLYLQFESYAFYSIWIFILVMLNTQKQTQEHKDKTKSMNKILVFGMTQNPGGVESVIMNYYKKIDKHKIQFDFLCNTEEVAYENEILKLGGKIYRITARSSNRNKYKKELQKFYEEHSQEYDTIWVNVCSLANIDYLKMAKKYNIKYRIIHSHNSENMDSKLRGILHKINKLFIRKYATDFWACSDEAGKWFFSKKIMDSDKYLVFNNAIDCNKFIYNENIRMKYRNDFKLNEKMVFGHIGRFHFQKNQIFLLEVFNEIHKINPDSELVLIGDGEDREKIKEKIKQLKIEDNVKLLGLRNDVEKVIQAMDAIIFPSLFEGLSLVLVEAQANGVPLFVSDTISQETKMGENITFISLDKNPKEWAQIILETNFDRANNTEQIRQKGFDINTEIEKMERLLMRN